MIERWVDLIALMREQVVAVELKMRDWRMALQQAIAYQLGADFSLVAMPLEGALAAFRNRHLFLKDDIGLMAVKYPEAEIRILIEPGESRRMIPFVRDSMFVEVEARDGRITRPRHQRKLRNNSGPIIFTKGGDYCPIKEYPKTGLSCETSRAGSDCLDGYRRVKGV